MTMMKAKSGDEFEYGCDLMEVTSNHRPDVGRILTDSQGHRHEWHAGGAPAKKYNPSESYEMPSLVWVKDGEEYWEDDDEPHDVGHHECRLCGEYIERPFTADTTRQYVPGLRWCRINGESVSREEFERRWVEASRTSA